MKNESVLVKTHHLTNAKTYLDARARITVNLAWDIQYCDTGAIYYKFFVLNLSVS